MIARVLSASGLLLSAGASATYLAYTLGERDALLPAALRARRPAFAFGLAMSAVGCALAPWRPAGWCSLAAAGALAAYAVKRQWLLPPPAPRYDEAPASANASSGLVLVLPDASAVRLRVLAHDRVAVVGPWLVVHCGLARSVTIYDVPDGEVRAVLPHRTGFWLSVTGVAELVDGVDGVGHDSGQPVLLRRAAEVRSEASWRESSRGSLLHAPPAGGRAAAERRLRVPSARGVDDPQRFGVVRDHDWRPTDLARPEPVRPGQFVLSRWAARARGLQGTEAP